MKFRNLRSDEIEVRVQSVKQNGLIALLYKDARCDMNILDETVGAENWTRHHYDVKGNLYCEVAIRIPRYEIVDGEETITSYEWVGKSDCGTESNIEAAKGEASDAFKRACFNWGIGRELYSSPFIWIPADACNINNGKCFDKFAVEKILIEDGKITALSIKNLDKKCRAFAWRTEEK